MNYGGVRTVGWFAKYRGQVGQWAQVVHRLTGLGIVAFLLAHILDTALVGFGPDAYNNFVAIYHNPIVRALEVVLVGVVVYHAVNGLRVTIIDFWDWGSLHQKQLFWTMMVVLAVILVPAAYIMMASVL